MVMAISFSLNVDYHCCNDLKGDRFFAAVALYDGVIRIGTLIPAA